MVFQQYKNNNRICSSIQIHFLSYQTIVQLVVVLVTIVTTSMTTKVYGKVAVPMASTTSSVLRQSLLQKQHKRTKIPHIFHHQQQQQQLPLAFINGNTSSGERDRSTTMIANRYHTITASSVPIRQQQVQRLYHSSPLNNFNLGNNNNNKNSNNNDDTGIIGQIKNVAKQILPSSWFQSKEERERIVQQKQFQKDVNVGIQQIFKDAPLPIRIVSNMIAPMMGSIMSTMAETISSQQDLVNIVYEQAVSAIQNDPNIQLDVGSNVNVGVPFSQSSSSSSINGISSTRIELAFPVSTGSNRSGVGRLVATTSNNNPKPIIELLQVQWNDGRISNINPIVSSSSSSSYSNRYNNNSNNNIIDAEIIEKKDTTRSTFNNK